MTAASFDTRRTDARQTQSFFREINNRVAELSRERDVSAPRFICECLNVDCGATIALSLTEYAKVRSDPACFIVLAGHEEAEIEDVLGQRGGCRVVRVRRVDTEVAATVERPYDRNFNGRRP